MVEKTVREVIDKYIWEENRKILVEDFHGVSGLANFSYGKGLHPRPPTDPHYHHGLVELHVLLKGNLDNRIFQDGRTRVFNLTGGEALAILPDEVHCSGDTRPSLCEEFGVQVRVDGGGEILGLSRDFSDLLRSQLLAIKNRHIRVPYTSISQLKNAFALFSTGEREKIMAGVQYLTCFLFQIPRMEPVSFEEGEKTGNDRICFALKYVENHYMEPIMLQDLAQESGYSLSRFKAIFLREVGMTPGSYVNRYKLGKAREYLSSTGLSVTEIAYRLGWSSSNYFCTVFRKHEGISPLQYRKVSKDRGKEVR